MTKILTVLPLLYLMMASVVILADAPKTVAQSASVKNLTYKEAKTECLKEDSTLKGQNLRACIHKKRQPAAK